MIKEKIIYEIKAEIDSGDNIDQTKIISAFEMKLKNVAVQFRSGGAAEVISIKRKGADGDAGGRHEEG